MPHLHLKILLVKLEKKPNNRFCNYFVIRLSWSRLYMKFILGLFSAGIIVIVYNYFTESNDPPRNLIKGIIEFLAIICIIIFFANRYIFLIRWFMKKIRFSLPIILGVIAILNLIQFIINWDAYFLSSSLLFGVTAIIFYFIISFTTDEDGWEK